MTNAKTFKTTALVLASIGVLAAPTAFAAPSAADEVKVTIDARYLETDWGVEKIYKTLTVKAESACNSGTSRDLANARIERDCMSNLLDDFVKNAGHDSLTAYHAKMLN